MNWAKFAGLSDDVARLDLLVSTFARRMVEAAVEPNAGKRHLVEARWSPYLPAAQMLALRIFPVDLVGCDAQDDLDVVAEDSKYQFSADQSDDCTTAERNWGIQAVPRHPVEQDLLARDSGVLPPFLAGG